MLHLSPTPQTTATKVMAAATAQIMEARVGTTAVQAGTVAARMGSTVITAAASEVISAASTAPRTRTSSEHKSEHVDKADASGKPSPADMIDRNTKLSDNLKADLPEGSDLKTEAEGFKNLGHFVAAVHVSKNLNVSFADLKAKMMAGDSLGQAIHALKPEVDSTKVADDALKQAGTEVTMQ